MNLNNSDTDDKKGTYIGLKVSTETRNNFKRWCIKHKIQNMVQRKKIHSTLIYSRKYCPDIQLNSELYPLEVNIKKMDFFSSSKEKKCLVFLLDSKELIDRHNYIMKKYKTTYDWDEYNPHITVSYDCGDINLDELTLPDFKVEITSEYMEDLNLDWADTAS